MMKIRTIFCAGILVSASCLWTVTSSIAWNKLFSETEDLVSEGENIRQADRNIEKLRKDAHRVGGPVYVKRVNRLSRSLEVQKSLAQGDVVQAQRIVRMAGSDILPSVRTAVQQAQKQKSKKRGRSQEQPVMHEKPIYQEPMVYQEQEREYKYVEKQREPERISLPVQELAAPEESHPRELMRAQRREKINQLVQEICVEDMQLIESLSAEGSAGQEEPTAEDIKSLTDDVQQDIAEFHTTLQATHEELPELDNFARDAESKAQACKVRIKDGLSKISAPQPQAQPAVAEPKVEKAKKQPKRVTFAPESELEKVKIIDEPKEEELSLFEGLTLAPQPEQEVVSVASTTEQVLKRYEDDLKTYDYNLRSLGQRFLGRTGEQLDDKKYQNAIQQLDTMRLDMRKMQDTLSAIADKPKMVENLKNVINMLFVDIDKSDMDITDRYVIAEIDRKATWEDVQKILSVAKSRIQDLHYRSRLDKYLTMSGVIELHAFIRGSPLSL